MRAVDDKKRIKNSKIMMVLLKYENYAWVKKHMRLRLLCGLFVIKVGQLLNNVNSSEWR